RNEKARRSRDRRAFSVERICASAARKMLFAAVGTAAAFGSRGGSARCAQHGEGPAEEAEREGIAKRGHRIALFCILNDPFMLLSGAKDKAGKLSPAMQGAQAGRLGARIQARRQPSRPGAA